MAIGAEASAVQKPFVKYAIEAGWEYVTAHEVQNMRRGTNSPVLDDVLRAQLVRLNPGTVDAQQAEDTLRSLITVRPSIDGNLDAWEFITGLKTVFVPSENRERNVRLADFDNSSANSYHVTDEFYFDNGVPPAVKLDIAFFINGVPVIVVETKRARETEGIAHAMDDIRYYHKKAPELLAIPQLYSLTHLLKFYYGGTWNLSRKGMFNWRDEQAGDFETLCKTFVNPTRVLRVLKDFVLFVRRDEQLQKAVLRPHQMRAVDRSLLRAQDPSKNRGLVWHTQGSGKTYTMITVAKKLIEDEDLGNPTVLMLIDRNELEGQLAGELESVGFVEEDTKTTVGRHVYHEAHSKHHLRELLSSDRRGLIVSMIHKFDGIPANICPRSNVFVLVDEAHRTTGGDLGNYLMGALPNATYLGYTGTPIDRTAHGRGTFKVFGADDEEGYLDKYSIRESVADGTTLKLHYSLAPNELQVDREVLSREFLDLKEMEGVSDIEEVNRVLEKAVTLKNMLKNPARRARVAEFVAKHFKSTVEPMGYKAFFVAVDREACALYKQELDKHLPSDYSEVIISSGGKTDPEILQEHHMTAEEEQQIRKEFRKPDTAPKILIVTEKLLTGFDAPVLYCMYLDKPMRDHVLLQAIARVNRPFEDDGGGRKKPAGFVLDFVGVFENLEKALAFDSEDVSGVVEGIDVLKERFEALIDEAENQYLNIVAGLIADKAVEAVIEHFRDQELRDRYYQFFRELQDIYEILSPDAFLRPFIPRYNRLSEMFHILRANYEQHVPVDHSFLRKTAALVQEHTESGMIGQPTKVYELDADALDQIAASKEPNAVKVFNLRRALRDHIEKKAAHQPYLIDIGERAEAIIAAYEERQLSTEEALQRMLDLLREKDTADQAANDTGLDREAFAIYWYLRGRKIDGSMNIAEAANDAMKANPNWKLAGQQERDLRVGLYVAMQEAGVGPEQMADLVKDMIDALRRAG